MPKVSSGKAPPARTATQEVDASPAREALKASSKRTVDAPAEQVEDPTRRHKKVKMLTRRHKSRLSEGESRSHSKGKEPTTPSEEPDTPAESEEGGASSVHRRPRLMKDLFKTEVHKDTRCQMERAEELDEGLERLVSSEGVQEGTSPPSTGAGALHTPLGGPAGPSRQGNGFGKFLTYALGQHFQMALFDRVHDVGRLITFMNYQISQLQQELDALKSGGGPKAVAKAEERASELQEELEKTRRERDEALLRCKASKKELHEVRSNLIEVQRLLKEARVRAQKMDDELLQTVKALKSAQAELPRQAVVQYKESLGFKEGLKRMGRATYEYGHRVVLARWRPLHHPSRGRPGADGEAVGI
ncbi:hypothetical protein B296_00048197 [Ensete ventricosum]|uniref:Uncharacterized protein n=1 Tax=Ensete ventricosum TaxID=4639 RepID=A0A426WXX4_ENSVE|nr:hypothetical protein B296_00048197 [Ensete ventricosum]